MADFILQASLMPIAYLTIYCETCLSSIKTLLLMLVFLIFSGEPFSQSLAKGLILVFFFIIASVLGTPWRQIRQVWNSAAL